MPLVDIPNQINNLLTLRQIMQTIDRLLNEGKGISDESLGYTIFLEGIIKSRKYQKLPIEKQLEIIKKAERSLQPPLTTARQTKEFFVQLGFLERSGYTYRITERGKKVVNAKQTGMLEEEEKNAWIEGLQNLTLTQKYASDFHPFRVFLNLLADETLQTKLLAFAFTVNDDSDKELNKVKEIVTRIKNGQSTWEKELKKANATESNALNSVKVLPGILEQLGIIRRSRGFSSLTEKGKTLATTVSSAPRTPKTLSSFERWFGETTDDSAEKASTSTTERKAPFFKAIDNEEELKRNWKSQDVDISSVQYDPKDDEERCNLLRERTDEHQETLVKFQKLFKAKGWRIGIGNFDLLAEKENVALLIEVKSIKVDDVSDERLRIIDGVGKLFFYESFDIPPILNNKTATVQKIMVFSRKPNSLEHVEFLSKLGIWVLWFSDTGQLEGETASKTAFENLLT